MRVQPVLAREGLDDPAVGEFRARIAAPPCLRDPALISKETLQPVIYTGIVLQ